MDGDHATSAAREERIPIAEALPGLAIHALPRAATALEAFVLIKFLDDEGVSSWAYRTTHPPNREELLGALVVQVAILKKELRDDWYDDD